MKLLNAAVFPAAAAVLLLTACSGPNHGTVHDRSFTPAHTTVTTSCSTVGNTTICHPVTQYWPDDYELDVYASSDDHGWVEVDATTWHTCHVGATYTQGDCR